MASNAKGQDPLASLAASLQGHNVDSAAGLATITGRPLPPVERWSPAYCGEIDIEIRADGSWWHEGAPIKRQELVKLFASILIREDEHYYLVTPVEKVRIRVALHPLIAIDAEPLRAVDGVDPLRHDSHPIQVLTLNTGGQIPVGTRYPLSLEPRANGAAFVTLERGLTALFSRAAWYRFVAAADDTGTVHSGDYHFALVHEV